jgi:prevent-host-death family protein
MAMHISEDIRPLSDLEKDASKVLEQLRETGRPIIITVKGKADAVLIDAKTYEKHLKAANMSRLLAPAEADVAAGRVRPAASFLKEFKNARKISG